VIYKILQHRSFSKEILKTTAPLQKKIYQIVSKLSKDPQKLPANTLPLKNFKLVYRTRLGDWRLIYQINHDDRVIRLLAVKPRGEVYRFLRRLVK